MKMTMVKLEFYMKRAEVDMDAIEAASDEKLISNVIKLCEENKLDQADSILLAIMDFECSWENMDCDPSEHLVSIDALPLNLSPVSYTHLRAHETRGNLVCRLMV